MNALNWFEIPVTDIDRATRFYQGMLSLDLKREYFGGKPHAIFPAKVANSRPFATAGLQYSPIRRPIGYSHS